MKSHKGIALLVTLIMAVAPNVWSHCEIPCGIYDDQARVSLLKEHITTIEKSMNQITALSTDSVVNYNQLVRWVTNKEDHATKFMDIVTQYFMTQRIKPAEASDQQAFDRYNESLRLLHQMLFYAMKCKQTTDLGHIAKLRDLVDRFARLYFGS